MRKFVGEQIKAQGFILARNLFAYVLNSLNGSEISPDPAKEMLVEEFSEERWILLSAAAGFCKMIFQFAQRNRWAKSQEFVGPSSPKAWNTASSGSLSSLLFPNQRHPFCMGKSGSL